MYQGEKPGQKKLGKSINYLTKYTSIILLIYVGVYYLVCNKIYTYLSNPISDTNCASYTNETIPSTQPRFCVKMLKGTATVC
jgi:hypothetical protein